MSTVKNKPATPEFFEGILELSRVTRVQRGGRRMRFRATVVVGNKKGLVGIGIGKATEVVPAIQKAVAEAKKHLVSVPLTENGSIPHRLDAKYKASKVVILPAAEGTGLIAGGAVRLVLEMAGVRNALSKRFGSSNPINNALATLYSMADLRDRS